MSKNYKLINYSEISRRKGLSREAIRPNNIPESYKPMMEELNTFLDKWAKKYLK